MRGHPPEPRVGPRPARFCRPPGHFSQWSLCLSGSIFGSIWNLSKTLSEGRVVAESPSQLSEAGKKEPQLPGLWAVVTALRWCQYIFTHTQKVGLGVLNTRRVVPQHPYPTRWTRYTRRARQRDTFCPCNSCFRVINIGASSFTSQTILLFLLLQEGEDRSATLELKRKWKNMRKSKGEHSPSEPEGPL